MAKVLVIDDSPVVFKMIKRALEPHGFELVGHAENGKVGLELYEQFQPDVVTLDVTMPVMDGIETASRLFGKYPEARVIMLSSMGDEELIETAGGAGIKHFFPKPIDAAALLDLVNTLLK